MIALVQRVSHASVEIGGERVGEIGPGLLILLGVHQDDGTKELQWVANKCANLRIFADKEGKMNLSLRDTSGDALVVSQFTLYGDTSKGNRPSFVQSAPPAEAERVYDAFVQHLEEVLGRQVSSGVFGATMKVSLVNEGPVTLWVEKRSDFTSSE